MFGIETYPTTQIQTSKMKKVQTGDTSLSAREKDVGRVFVSMFSLCKHINKLIISTVNTLNS